VSALNKELLMDAVGMLDDELITNHLRMRERLQKRKAVAWKRSSLVAACLAVVMLISYGASYIPKTYETDYQPPDRNHEHHVAYSEPKQKSYWVYYVNDLGLIQRERVKMYGDEWFLVWKELNGIGDDLQILKSERTGRIPIFYTEDGDLEGYSIGVHYIWTVTLSDDLTEYDHYEKRLKSLFKTMRAVSDADEIRLAYVLH
jgi:hypothetical protein